MLNNYDDNLKLSDKLDVLCRQTRCIIQNYHWFDYYWLEDYAPMKYLISGFMAIYHFDATYEMI